MTTTTTTTTAAAGLLLANAADIDQRFKRHALWSGGPLEYGGSGNEELNEMSQHALRSIEAFLAARADGGNCLRRTLCEATRYSRDTSGGQRVWIPVWRCVVI